MDIPAEMLAPKNLVTNYTLAYFDGFGLAETSRLIFAVAGQKFVDHRYAIDTATGVHGHLPDKEAGKLDLSLGKLPLLYINDVPVLGQSAVISRFLARRFGMMGDDDLEAAQNEMNSEHICDIKADCLKAKAAEDEAHSGEWTSTVLSKSCINLDKVVALTSKAHGNAVGASKHPHVQLGDLEIWSLLHDCLWAGAPGTHKTAAREAAKTCPHLLAIAAKVDASPVLKAYIATRKECSF